MFEYIYMYNVYVVFFSLSLLYYYNHKTFIHFPNIIWTESFVNAVEVSSRDEKIQLNNSNRQTC